MSHIVDQALDILKDAGPEYGNGFSNHAPMAAEALLAVGREDAIISRYRSTGKDFPHTPQATRLLIRRDFKKPWEISAVLRTGLCSLRKNSVHSPGTPF
jgi:hypothetical protein